MASHRTPKKTGRTALTIATATAATAAGVAIAPGAASADSVQQAKTQYNALEQQAEQATATYDKAQEQLSKLQSQLNELQARIATEQQSINTLEGSLGALAAAQYRDSGMSEALQLMLSQHPDQFLQQSTMMDELTSQETSSLKQLQAAERQMKQDRLQAAQELAQQQAEEKALADARTTIQNKLNQAQQIYNNLSAADQASLNSGGSSGGGMPSMKNSAPASARAGEALAAAETRIGDEYVFGTNGPSTFDCSGLIQWAFAQVGVSVPRDTWDQAAAFTPISESQLQPGDVIFFYGDDHVGFFAGWAADGTAMVFHAPRTGERVQYTPLKYMQAYYSGAYRVPS